MRLVIGIFVALLVVSLSMPIPEHPQGYIYKEASKKTLRLDVFEDPLCSACKAFDPPFKKFLDNYKVNGDAVTDYVEVAFHMFPLPYHRFAFFVSRLAPYVYEETGCGHKVAKVASWALATQDTYLKASDKNDAEVLDLICTNFSEKFQSEDKFDKASCLKAINDRKYELLTRTGWKFGTYKGVNGTPTVHLNGVEVSDVPFDEKDWEEFLKPYLPEH